MGVEPVLDYPEAISVEHILYLQVQRSAIDYEIQSVAQLLEFTFVPLPAGILFR
jgi:hypothetical protein